MATDTITLIFSRNVLFNDDNFLTAYTFLQYNSMFFYIFCSIIERLKRLSSSSIIQRLYWDRIEEIIKIDTGQQVRPNLTANNKCRLIFDYHICASMIAACSWLIALYFYLWHMPDDATEDVAEHNALGCNLPSSIRIHRGKYTFQRKLKLYLLNRVDI